jgi:hypothetical protein
MTGPVELGAYLAKLGGHVFVVVDELFSAEGTTGGQSRNNQPPAP